MRIAMRNPLRCSSAWPSGLAISAFQFLSMSPGCRRSMRGPARASSVRAARCATSSLDDVDDAEIGALRVGAASGLVGPRQELDDELEFLIIDGWGDALDDAGGAADLEALANFELVVEADVAGRDDVFAAAELVAVAEGHRRETVTAPGAGSQMTLASGMGVGLEVRHPLTRCQPRSLVGRPSGQCAPDAPSDAADAPYRRRRAGTQDSRLGSSVTAASPAVCTPAGSPPTP